MDSHERKRDKMKQIATARIAQSEKGIAHVVNDLSNPLGLTLNQRATELVMLVGVHLRV